jgi:membrane protease YdiL (CAAX protease family)
VPITPKGSTTESLITRHALAAYLMLVFLIAWLFWIPLAVLSRIGYATLGSPLAVALQTLGVTAPLISVIVVLGLTRGKRGIARLLGGLKRWRVGPWWYAAACLLVPVMTVIGLGIRAALHSAPAVPEGSVIASTIADIGWIGIALTFPLWLVVACFGSPLLEEPGWRGFAFPQMQRRMPAAWAALLVGAIWGLWHIPLNVAFDENLASSLALITMHGFFIGWLYANTRSLLIVVLGHASLSVANNKLSLAEQGVVQIAITLLLCLVIFAFFRVNDLRPRRNDPIPLRIRNLDSASPADDAEPK